jgi:hypothetical protein
MGMLFLFLETRHESFGYLACIEEGSPGPFPANERRTWKTSRCNGSPFPGTTNRVSELVEAWGWLIPRERQGSAVLGQTCWKSQCLPTSNGVYFCQYPTRAGINQAGP